MSGRAIEKKNVKIALWSLSTFGYFERLTEHFCDRGIDAKFFDERPSNSVIAKIVFRFLPKKLTRILVRHHLDAICNEIISKKYTHVLIALAELLAEPEIQKLRDHGIYVFRYTWDSLANRPGVRHLDVLMDAIGSFDPEDCSRFGYKYIPLYSEILAVPAKTSHQDRPIDFCFCGTMHSNRPNIISMVEDVNAKRHWQFAFKLFYHSRLLYVIRNFFSWRALKLFGQISQQSVSHSRVLEDCRNSKVVLDVNHPKQHGLTMRTFEALAQGAILLTTNRMATSKLEHGLSERVVFLDIENIEASMERAVLLRPTPLSEEQRQYLSIQRFIDDILELAKIV